jgi:hypothetical protein
MQKVSQNKVSVYFHLNPETGIPFYVGIGVKYRPYRKSGRSVLWNRFASKHGFQVKIVHEFDTWQEAVDKEIEYIKLYGRIDNRTGILVNHTNGGDGSLGNITNVGRKQSEETKSKRSKALKGIKPASHVFDARVAAGYKAWNKGVAMKEETKRKIAESMRGRKVSDEIKKKLSEIQKGRVFSIEHRMKNSEGVKRYWANKKAM